MNSLLKFSIALIIASFVYEGSMAQSPWVRAHKKGYIQVGGSSIMFRNIANANGIEGTGRTNYDITTQLYAEFGLYKNGEITIILPFKSMGYKDSITNISESLNSFGNVQLGLKHALIDKKIKLSAGFVTSFKTINQNQTSGLRTGFNANTYHPYITLGTSFSQYYCYILAGYSFMDHKYSDYVRVAGEIGRKFGSKTHLIFASELRKSVSSDGFEKADNPSFARTSSYLDNQQFLSIGIKVNYEFVPEKMGATLSGFGALYLKNVSAAPALNLSIYRKF